MTMPNSRASTSILSAVANCSSVCVTPCERRFGMKELCESFLSSQPIALFERRLNHARPAIPRAESARRATPAMRTFPNVASSPAGGVIHKRQSANRTTTAIESHNRSIIMVTNDAAGRTRESRIGSTTGLTTSPARPKRKTAPKPTVVATKSSLRLAGVSGNRSARQRKERKP